jgi:hypothetical protein
MIGVINNNMSTGFHLTFANELTISVQIGTGNYCENRSFGFNQVNPDVMSTCFDAEIAIWNSNNVWYRFEIDTVKGWVKPNEIAACITAVSSATDLSTIQPPV